MLDISLMGHSYRLDHKYRNPTTEALKKNPSEFFKRKVKLSTATQYSIQMLAFPYHESLS